MNAFGIRHARWDVGRPPGMPSLALIPPAEDHAAHIRAVASSADRSAFGALFRHFAPRVKTLLMRAGASAASAEEIAQETMLTVWRKAAQFDADRASAATWIFTIARNLRIDILRREHHPDTLLPDQIEQVDDGPRADEVLLAGERDLRVRAAMASLSREQIEVVRAAFFLDKPHAEIERDLNIPLGTVKSRLRLAMAKLRGALKDFS
ncbi:MAG: sigma-70 family RNA polymerase sigma factor [Rhodospirillales bacterium]